VIRGGLESQAVGADQNGLDPPQLDGQDGQDGQKGQEGLDGQEGRKGLDGRCQRHERGSME
jgi:hypothetical protein